MSMLRYYYNHIYYNIIKVPIKFQRDYELNNYNNNDL